MFWKILDLLPNTDIFKMMNWDAYKELVSVDEEETEEVTEYASLVGKQVASRMLLYRPNWGVNIFLLHR